ncbi:MAG: MinD/ParA family protein [Limnochordales bacterium]
MRAVRDQAQSLRELARAAGRGARRARVLTVTSGKGGVGKTNLSVNLGIALVRRGLRVVVVDADLGLANVDSVLGVDVERSLWDLLHGGLSVEDVLVPGPGGLEILPGGSGVHELAALSDGDLRRLLHHIEQLDAMFDVMLIDTGAGIGRDVINFALAGDEVLIVTTTDPSALADAYAMVKVISARRADARLLIAVNMAADFREGEATFQRLDSAARRFLGVQTTLLGVVPRDAAVIQAVKRQQPFVLATPQVAAARAVEAMARRLAGVPEAEPAGLSGLIRRLLRLDR